MKKIFQIIIAVVAIILLFLIAKFSLFTDDNTKFYKDGWTAYENKQHDLTIFYLNHVDKNKYPDIVAPLGFSYFENKDYENAYSNLKEAYDKKIGKQEGYYDKILNTLGIISMEKKDFAKSEKYFIEAQKLGNPNSKKNLQILDSLEQSKK